MVKSPDYVFIESGNHLMSEKRFTDSSSLIGHFNYILLNKNNFDFVGYKKFIKITLLTLFPLYQIPPLTQFVLFLK